MELSLSVVVVPAGFKTRELGGAGAMGVGQRVRMAEIRFWPSTYLKGLKPLFTAPPPPPPGLYNSSFPRDVELVLPWLYTQTLHRDMR